MSIRLASSDASRQQIEAMLPAYLLELNQYLDANGDVKADADIDAIPGADADAKLDSVADANVIAKVDANGELDLRGTPRAAVPSQDEINGEDRVNYPYLPLYWQRPDRFPYLLLADAKTAGFALVRQEVSGTSGKPIFEMAEFFVLPAWRRQALGQAAFRMLLGQHPGSWQLAVLAGNHPALSFWQHCLKRLGLDYQERETTPGSLFEFNSA